MQDTINKGYEYFVQYGMNVAAAIIIFVVGQMVSKFVAELAAKTMTSANVSKTLTSFGRHLVFYVAMTFVCIAALNKLGVETTSFIAVLGAASLAVGLALQGSLSNFASGVLIVLFQLFKVGDTIDAAGASGGAKGRVDEIQIFYTVLTSDGKRIIVPNSKITGDKITIEPS
ncbi:MAG: mechanosensitive ion channel [Candidatus Omnitrophica bacterium]|nr:mechanosensitive ion channel [Candidatus Omnitrophota bacterium]